MIKGEIINHKKQGLIEYLGIDVYFGETTFKFRRLTDNSIMYELPESLTQGRL